MRIAIALSILAVHASCLAVGVPDDDSGVVEDSLGTVPRFKFVSPRGYLIVEILDDDLAHFELSAVGAGPDVTVPVYTTPMVAKRDYPGPTSVRRTDNVIETPGLRITVDPSTLCADIVDVVRGLALTAACPADLDQDWKALTLAKRSMRNAYGLGEQFVTPGSAFGDWVGRVRSPGGSDGNAMVAFNGGYNGNATFPILYALGTGTDGYAVFLDQLYKQEWDLTGDPWAVHTWGDQIRFYVMTGPDLPDLRSDYLELTGRPPVPPKRAFGLWVSEYGYDDWNELEGKLAGLRADKFPVDGFALDLQWFGGVTADSDTSKMGTLTFDPVRFPDARTEIASLRARGVGVMPIEESYVSRGLPEHTDLAARGFLARDSQNGPPTYITGNPWWGKGGMIDWTNPAAGDYWHDTKRQPLIDLGVVGHWTDLGEPEMYNWWAWYYGFPELGKQRHADVHNVFALDWLDSIARGYRRHGVQQRPFMLSRTGTSGIQRFGAAMWSADIGSDLSSLATHDGVQMQMSLSGIDYFGADIGGFHRGALRGDRDEMFTQWFANGMMFDVPGRTHTENLCNCKETAPDRIGDRASNLANLRLRYQLSPYVYSLAHAAARTGAAVFPPLVYYFQDDLAVRDNGHEKMLGPSLVAAIVAGYGETDRDVYLPRGSWIDWRTGEWFRSTGEWLRGVPEYRDGRFGLPLFARAGAIIPEMVVDDHTVNVLGQRDDGPRRDDLVVRVFADQTASSFTLVEDDGETIGYQSGAVRDTVITQQLSGGTEAITIGAASGTYPGAPTVRPVVVELVTEATVGSDVRVDGVALARRGSRAELAAAGSGWWTDGAHLTVIAAGSHGVDTAVEIAVALAAAPARASASFTCTNASPGAGEAVYAIGNVAMLGGWNAAGAVRLAHAVGSTWTGVVDGLPPGTAVEWKCVTRAESGGGVTRWQPGANSRVTTAGSGFSGTTRGSF